MPLRVELMIFDFDGTLVNTGEDIANSVNYTLTALKLPLLEKEVILTYIGDGVIKLIDRAMGVEGKDRREDGLQIFSDHYDRHMLDHAALYPGVYDVLDYFREKRKIILTNKRLRFAEKMAAALKILPFFEATIGADSTPFIKPDPRIMEMICQQFSIPVEHIIIIGDGVNDVRLAKNTGIFSGCYLNGLGNREELIDLHPDFTFEHFHELKDHLI
ncbi:MAG: HAD-IA family hydrolase [Syntrophaceae bacterium]|nr:HAD-IA family hydrolase [Syntrophaceae bacterium]